MRDVYPGYHAAPVAAFGSIDAALLVVGLAPGMHGANASGRPFTGDTAGVLLYQTLYDAGFASAPVSPSADDGLALYDCRIINAVCCLPPGNRPTAAKINHCNGYLRSELARPRVLVALGGLAHKALVRALGRRQKDLAFGHGREYALDENRVLIDSYHCSRYNTDTGWLTSSMFAAVFARARAHVDAQGLPAGQSASS